jgi:ABC-type multidrug transport system fused ATPase/permease subunit
VTNDVDTISQTLNQSLTQLVTSIVTVVGVLIMMFFISWQMTLVALVMVPVSGLLVMVVVKKSQGYFKTQQETLGRMNGHVEEMYGGNNVVQAFNGEDESIEQFEIHNTSLYTSAWKSQFLSGLMMPMMNFVSNLGYVAICIIGGYLAVKIQQAGVIGVQVFAYSGMNARITATPGTKFLVDPSHPVHVCRWAAQVSKMSPEIRLHRYLPDFIQDGRF